MSPLQHERPPVGAVTDEVRFAHHHEMQHRDLVTTAEEERSGRELPLGWIETTQSFEEGEDRVLPLDRMAAGWAVRFRADSHRSGRVLDPGDALIAGTARAHDLSLATRNVRDFGRLDIEVTDPWKV